MSDFISTFIQLPGFIILLLLLGLFYHVVNVRLSGYFLSAALIILYIASIPLGGYLLVAPLYTYKNMTEEQLTHPDASAAIVVLGGGRDLMAREFRGSDVVSMYTLVRLRYAAWLYAQMRIPILVSGGRKEDEGVTEASLMANELSTAFGIHVTWQEERSTNTHENADFTAKMLLPEGITQIYLVTDAEHMFRAYHCFKIPGVKIIPAATGFMNRPAITRLDSWLPSPMVLARSARAVHEYFGIIYYSLSGNFSDRMPG